MEALRQKIRPKHQVLILKCYPKFQKNTLDVKPRPSELSYLLYYASTRRSKVQKVGAYLERKTVSDVSRRKLGNVQVTLQILAKLIDKSPRDIPLYAVHLLRIIVTVLRSKDITMVEETVPVMAELCQHHDITTLGPDPSVTGLYEEIVDTFASFASPKRRDSRFAASSIRWRSAGLRAIYYISEGQYLKADSNRQLRAILPQVLRNLQSLSGAELLSYSHQLEKDLEAEKEREDPRPSFSATVRSDGVDEELTAADADEATAATTADADKRAEMEVEMIALRCLHRIFSVSNRMLVRGATSVLLSHVLVSATEPNNASQVTVTPAETGSWPMILFETIARWTPVQDRFIIAITSVEILVRTQLVELKLPQQLQLASMIDWLLSSSVNMIGLSVIDVLIAFIQYMLQLLQLSGRGTMSLPQYERVDTLDVFEIVQGLPLSKTASTPETVDRSPSSKSLSSTRQALLETLQKCIASLATHLYYTDQITDIISTLLARIKPSAQPKLASAANTVDRPADAAETSTKDNESEEFFTFGTARLTALNAIRDVLKVSNAKSHRVTSDVSNRTPVGVHVWDGSQWLLRDEDRRVRRAYVDAVSTWMQLEMGKDDLHLMDELPSLPTSPKSIMSPTDNKGTRQRSGSTFSRKPIDTHSARSTFLPLLHLAIYDDTLEAPEDTADIVLTSILLDNLVEKLGVNAVRHGLPMMMTLEKDLQSSPRLTTDKAKINVGSLIHGYLACICKKFDIETTLPGYEINQEISRRQKHDIWLKAIDRKPVELDKIAMKSSMAEVKGTPLTSNHETLRPFERLDALVTQIADAYQAIRSPPVSPPGSPGRSFSMPSPGFSTLNTRSREMPNRVKDAMLTPWTRDDCAAFIARENAKSSTLRGHGVTRAPSNSILRNANGLSSRDRSPTNREMSIRRAKARTSMGPTSPRSTVTLLTALNSPGNEQRSPSADTHRTPSMTSSDRFDVVRVDELKRVLTGGASALSDILGNGKPESMRTSSPLRASHFLKSSNRGSVSVGSESMVDAEGYTSSDGEHEREHELSTIEETPRKDFSRARASSTASTKRSVERARPRSGSSTSAEDPEANARALKGEIVTGVGGLVASTSGDDVPPVPPLPEGIVGRAQGQAQPTIHTTTNTTPHYSMPFRPASSGQGTGQGTGQTTLELPPLDFGVKNTTTSAKSGVLHEGDATARQVSSSTVAQNQSQSQSQQTDTLSKARHLLAALPSGGLGSDSGGGSIGAPPY